MQKINKRYSAPLHKNREFRYDEKGNLIVSGFFTSDNKDAVGDIITKDATQRAIPSYKEWGNIRFMHKPEPIGKVLKIGESDGMLWNEMEIKVVDKKAINLVEEEIMTAFSVGIMIDWDDIEELDDGGWIISDYSMVEISLVDHPANYDAKLGKQVLSGDKSELRLKGFAIDVSTDANIEGNGSEKMADIEILETVGSDSTGEEVIEAVEVVELSIDLTEIVEEEVVEEDEVLDEAIEEEVEDAVEVEEAVPSTDEEIEEISLSVEADIERVLEEEDAEIEEEVEEEVIEESTDLAESEDDAEKRLKK